MSHPTAPTPSTFRRWMTVSTLGLVILTACSPDGSSIIGVPASISSPGASALGRNDNAGGKLAKPGNISATVKGQTIAVRWDAVAEAGEYKVDACLAGACTSVRTRLLNASVANMTAGSWSITVRARRDQPASVTDENNGWGEAASTSATVQPIVVVAAPPADHTPPVVTYSISGSLGRNGWYVTAPTITWTVTDAESAVTSTCPAVTVSTETAPQGIAVSCTGASAGGSTTRSVTVTFDATAPVIAFAGNAAAYTVDQAINISCGVFDAASGVASRNCPGLSSDAYLLPLGANSTSGSAGDNAGNASAASRSFNVAVTYVSLCNLVKRFTTNAGIANSLCVKLDAASRAQERGQLQAKAGSIGAFRNEVSAQTGKWIPADMAAHLIRLAAGL